MVLFFTLSLFDFSKSYFLWWKNSFFWNYNVFKILFMIYHIFIIPRTLLYQMQKKYIPILFKNWRKAIAQIRKKNYYVIHFGRSWTTGHNRAVDAVKGSWKHGFCGLRHRLNDGDQIPLLPLRWRWISGTFYVHFPHCWRSVVFINNFICFYVILYNAWSVDSTGEKNRFCSFM